MSTSEVVIQTPTESKHQYMRLFSWLFSILLITMVALLAVSLEKPTGSISGRVSLELMGFHMKSYNFREHKAYALVDGPRQHAIERGTFINPDGTFTINNLPVGEYHIKVRAKGFTTYEQSGVFIDEGKVTNLGDKVALSILTPSLTLGQHARVFTSKEKPVVFANTVGADSGTVKLYKTDIIKFARDPKIKKMLYFSSDMSVAKNSETVFVNPFKDQTPALTQSFKLEQDSSDSARAVVSMPAGLPAGDYVAYSEVNGLNGVAKDLNWFTISDVGLIIKRDSEKIIARAIDLNTYQPVKGCAVSVLDNSNMDSLSKPVLTAADGTATISLSDENPLLSAAAKELDLASTEFVFLGAINNQRAYGNISQSSLGTNAEQTYFYTDKSVYRLGQTVNYKAICREKTTHGFKNIGANISIDAVIEDPDNNQIWSGKVTTNAHGTFTGSFNIPLEGKTGGYQFKTTYPDGSEDYGAFEVAEYRKPEYQVEMSALTPRVSAGDPGKMRLKASYYFGAPVAHAKIKYSVYSANDWMSQIAYEPRPDYFEFFDSWNENYNTSYDGDMEEEGVAETDENGEAIITFKTKAKVNPAFGPNSSDFLNTKYTVRTEVTDLSRLTVDGSASLSSVAGDFMLFVTPDSSIMKVGEKVKGDVTAESYEHKMLPNQKVDLTLRRYEYDSVSYTYRESAVLGTVSATTDASGKAKFSFDVGDQYPSDSYYITAHAQDETRHQIYSQSSVWIANENYPFVKTEDEAESQPLTIRTDKDIYKPGDVAKVMITAPLTGKEGIDAVVTVEGLRIYDYKIVHMDATAKTFEIPITPDYAPNVFFDVALVGKKHEFYSGEQMIKVSPEQNFLKIAIATNKDRYQPGETATYTLTATHQDGTPASDTELSLGVIDESVYAIRGEQAEDIRRFYYNRRDNSVATANSFPMMYTGGPDKIEPRVRHDFKDTAAWIPDIATDKNGVAKVSFKLPDNLTTWRATVRGVDMKTSVGSAVQKVIATQDFILRIALPRFFSDGDEGVLTAIVHNYTKQEQTVKLALTTSNQFNVQTDKKQELKIGADKAARYSWPIVIKGSGTGVVKATAIGQTAGDAMETKLPIRPLGIPAFTFKSGEITDDKQTVSLPLGISADADKSTFKGELTMSSSTIGPVLGNFDKLIDYPYGCTEQTMSKLIPSVVAMQLHKKLNIDISAANAKKFAVVQKQSFEKLSGYHHADGGWGWWAEDQSNTYLTPYVVQGLSLLKISGCKVDDALISSGLGWMAKASVELKNQMSAKDHVLNPYSDSALRTDLARMLYTMSLWNTTPESLLAPDNVKGGAKNPAKANTIKLSDDLIGPVKAINPPAAAANQSAVREWLVAQTPQLAPEALSYLTLTCKKFNADKDAAKTYARLSELANKSTIINWDHTQFLADKLLPKQHWSEYDYRFTGTETTALALKAVLTMEPDNNDKIESIKQWLLLQRDGNGWSNTKTTAEVFLVLLQEELQSLAKHPTDFTVNANVAGQRLFETAYTTTNSYTPEVTTNIPLSLADRHNDKPQPKTDNNKLNAEHTLSITKDGPGRLYWSTLFTYFRKLLPNDQIAEKGLPQGLKITRKFYRMKPVATTTNGAIHLKSEEITDGKLKAGETIMMRVFVDAPVSIPYVKLEAALPSGAEVVLDKPNDNVDDAQNQMEGDWGTPWWTHQDILDDRIVYFGTSLPAGKSEFFTMLRMELPGAIQINPVSLEGMYTDKVRAYSALGSLRISD